MPYIICEASVMNLPWLIILIAVFGLVYSVSVEAVSNFSPFSHHRVISACVAALSALGMWIYFGGERSETTQLGGLFEAILLPYVAMPIALVILILLAFVRRLVWRPRDPASPQRSRAVKNERSID